VRRILPTLFLLLLALAPASASAASVARPPDAWLASVGPRVATLAWSPARGATSYEVRRGSTVVATVTGTRLTLRNLRPATSASYYVYGRAGTKRSFASDPIPVTTLAPTGCTHYVSSASGSDSGDGSAASPWRTIGHLTDLWRPGWVGCVEGSFVEDVSIFRGGTASSKVVLRARPGATASLRGRLWVANGADHVVVANLVLDGRANEGEGREDLPSPTVNGDGAMFLGNDVSNARTRVCFVLGSIRGYGSTSDTTLAYNRIHHCGQRGRNTHHGIYVESAYRTRIVHNVIYRNADRGIQLYPNAQQSLIMRNLFEGNGEGLIFSGAEGYASSGNRVLRNVFANSMLRSNIEHYWDEPNRIGTGNVAIRNCLGGAREGNLALPTRGYAAHSNTVGTLRYRAPSSADFRLVRGSGCASTLRGPIPLAPR